jgi:hypothetical protein
MLQDELMDVRVDPGALVSMVPLQLIQRLGLETDMGPSDESLKFAGGQVERVTGTIDLQLLLSEDLEITHSFMVADNFYMPFLLGLDFLLSTGAEILQKEHTLRFVFSDDDIVDIPMLIGLKTKEEDDSQDVPSVFMLMKVKKEHPMDTQGFRINPSLPQEQRVAILDILSLYQDCFADSVEDIRIIDETPVKIDLIEDAVPHHTQPYRLTQDQNIWLKSYLQRLLEADLIEPSQSAWAAGVVLVPADIDKRRTSKRSVIRPSNPLEVKSQYPYGKFIASVEPHSQEISPLDVSFYETNVIPPSFTVTTIAPEVNGPL